MITRVIDGVLHMRCLTLKQPYAYFMCDLPPECRKDVENRVRTVTSEMGPLLIHTSATKDSPADRLYFDTACEQAERRGVPRELLPRYEDLERGVLYGCLRLTGILPKASLMDGVHRWKFPGQVGYMCSGAMRLPARPLRGQQTIFYVPLAEHEEALLREAGFIFA